MEETVPIHLLCIENPHRLCIDMTVDRVFQWVVSLFGLASISSAWFPIDHEVNSHDMMAHTSKTKKNEMKYWKKKFKRKNFWSDHMIKYNYFLLIIYLVSGMDQQYGVLAHLSTQQNKKTNKSSRFTETRVICTWWCRHEDEIQGSSITYYRVIVWGSILET